MGIRIVSTSSPWPRQISDSIRPAFGMLPHRRPWTSTPNRALLRASVVEASPDPSDRAEECRGSLTRVPEKVFSSISCLTRFDVHHSRRRHLHQRMLDFL